MSNPPVARLAGMAVILLAVGLFLALAIDLATIGSSADLRALWLAGQWMAEGRPDLVYPADTSHFTILPPQEWITRLQAEGYRGDVFPFIYPPIWAWVAAHITRMVSYDTFITLAALINPLLMAASVILASTLAPSSIQRAYYLAIGFALLLLTQVGLIALYQNQPQILVAFLTILAIERAERGAPRTAGAALALAAAIKLYPAIFALFWFASGQRRATLYFCIFGGSLGLLSLGLTGWPMHQDFLRVIHAISETAVMTKLSYSLDSLATQLFYPELIQQIHAPQMGHAGDKGSWLIAEKPALLSIIFKMLQVAALVGLFLLFRACRSNREQRILLWPVAMTLISLLGPLAWADHFLAPLAFAPMLVAYWRPWIALLGLFAGTFAVSPFTRLLIGHLENDREITLIMQAAGTLAFVALTVAFGAAILRATTSRSGPRVDTAWSGKLTDAS